MADWRRVAAEAGWTPRARSVAVVLGSRRHTVHVEEGSEGVTFTANLPDSDIDPIGYLTANRSLGHAYWRIVENKLVATSRCPAGASALLMASYIRETAALADRAELAINEIDF